MSTLGFDEYYDPLKVYLTKYRESIKGKDSDDKKKEETRCREKLVIRQLHNVIV